MIIDTLIYELLIFSLLLPAGRFADDYFRYATLIDYAFTFAASAAANLLLPFADAAILRHAGLPMPY